MESIRVYFKEELGKIAIKIHVELRSYLDKCLAKVMKKEGTRRRKSKEGRGRRRTCGRQVDAKLEKGRRGTASAEQKGDKDTMSDDGNCLSVGDEQEYKDDGLVSLGNSTDGTRSDEEYPSDIDKERRHRSDAGALSDSCKRLKEEIAQHGTYRYYPNGDGDEDDFHP